MVNTLLQVYCYEAGQKTLAFTAIDMEELLSEVIQALMPLALEKGLALALKLDKSGGSVEIKGDRLELRRVFTNLIGNAVKFTDTGSVDVILCARKPTNAAKRAISPTWIQVDVKDTGPGIPPEYRAFLFEPFRHGKHKRSGSGLGLNLSFQIIKAHQGAIAVQSDVGQGSTFTVQLPTQQPTA
jgi:signal transduction histidine kinase